jgi:hypothetical protein
MAKTRKPQEHIWIPDTQVRKGVGTDHIKAVANYIAEKRPQVIVVGGDWFDLPSLSSYEKPGSKFFEDIDLEGDIDAGNVAWRMFKKPIDKVKAYSPRIVFVEGNHEYRMQRAINQNPTVLEGILGRHMFAPYNDEDVEWHDFLDIVTIDGIMYSHYFCNPQSLMKNVLGGQMDNRLNKLKRSFTQGHQQTLITGSQYLPGGQRIRGLVAGAFYSHDEEYAGPQGNDYWRGVVYKHEVVDGDYDLMEVSIEYLLENWL